MLLQCKLRNTDSSHVTKVTIYTVYAAGLNNDAGRISAELEEIIDDVNPEKFERDKDVDIFLRMEAKGERLPHVSTWNKDVLPPEDPETYLE